MQNSSVSSTSASAKIKAPARKRSAEKQNKENPTTTTRNDSVSSNKSLRNSQTSNSSCNSNTKRISFKRKSVDDDSGSTSPTVKMPRMRHNSTTIAYQMDYCRYLLKELLSKKHLDYAWPFYKPVDVKALCIPDYFDVITQPMDMSTIRVQPLF